MNVLALFGIADGEIGLVADLAILILIAVWISLVYWTYVDAKKRIDDGMLVVCATLASLFPFIGTVVYSIVRPPEYLEDVRERELELKATEANLHEVSYRLCPECDYPVERDYLICPNCVTELKVACGSCSKPVDPSWRLCPYCTTPIAQSASAGSDQEASGDSQQSSESTQAFEGDWLES